MTQTEQVSSRVEEKYNGEEKTSVAGRLRFHASTPETSCDFTGSTLNIAFCHRMRLHGRLGFTKQILAFGRRYRKGPFATGELHLVQYELFAIFARLTSETNKEVEVACEWLLSSHVPNMSWLLFGKWNKFSDGNGRILV